MKYFKNLSLIVFVNFCFCSNALSSCSLDVYLMKSKTYRSFNIEQEETSIQNKHFSSSYLPSISVGMGQYINNDKGFVDLGKTSFYISASQLIFSGESLGYNNKKNEIDNNRRHISFEKEKNDMLLKIYEDTIQHKYLSENIKLTLNQLNKVQAEYQKSLLDLKSGNIPSLEVDVKSLNVSKMKNTLNTLYDDLKLLEEKFIADYSIPPENISKITDSDIISCKSMGYRELLETNKQNKLQQADVELDINKSALLPSVYLSVGLTPKNEGTLRDLNLRTMNYNGGISVSIPLTNIFNSFANQEKFALSVTKANLESDDEKKKLLIMKKNILNKYSNIKNDIPILEKEVELKRKKIEYLQWMVKDKKENVLSYLNSQDELYDSTIKLNKYKRDLKYYKLYLDFIN
ncbi:TolC family protein [Escherichia coli]|nr:TolC family protein [Escherichia coli]EEQ8441292.1 TolC family protein [Escherichia coli]EER2993241.1 TolC family protein [Escherichia coli]EES0864681.1 TolC family protein [Escherichia coli]EES7659314.1 TolC family protein [Escherichia coli]